ncbi:MAG: ATP-binding cassette domain-containing protein [Bacteroidaceae bacterium]|nr:ATP-binding cassette domain-containing protein [Bacteroidaceae bacterium]
MKGEEYILKVNNLNVAYNNHIVIRDFSMQLRRGEMVAITGASGSGKSSLLRALMGFVPLTSGEIIFDGAQMHKGQMEKLRRQTAFLPQDLSFPCEWVSEVLETPFLFKNNKSATATKAMWQDSFQRLGLDEKIMDKRLNEISGGQRQRMLFAVIAMLDKELILLDEPTSALDSGSAMLVTEFIKEMCESGKSILAVTHDKQFAAECDRIINISTV